MDGQDSVFTDEKADGIGQIEKKQLLLQIRRVKHTR